MSIAGKLLRYFVLLWVATLSIGVFWLYANFDTTGGFFVYKQRAVASGFYLPFFYSHIFVSSIVLLLGFFQFSKRVYTNLPLHRKLGKIYVFGVLFFAAPGAYGMTFFINRGTGVFLSFLIQNTLWVIFTLMGWRYAVKGKITQHIGMMNRSYGLAFAAVTLRFYLWLAADLKIDIDFQNNYLIIAFLSWVPNLILVELLLRYNKPVYLPKQAGR